MPPPHPQRAKWNQIGPSPRHSGEMLFKGVKCFIEETPRREERSPRERGSLTGLQMEGAPWRMWPKPGSRSVRRRGGGPRLATPFICLPAALGCWELSRAQPSSEEQAWRRPTSRVYLGDRK